MAPAPEWVTQYIEVCKGAFGLQGWRVEIAMERRIDEHDPIGRTSLDSRYWRVLVHLRDTIEPDDEGYCNLTHEMIHVATAAQDMAVDRIIDLVPKSLKEHARTLWTDGDEQATEKMAKSLTPVLRKQVQGKA